MKHSLCLFALSLTALVVGCIPLSLHPLYTEETQVFEPKLVGAWVADEANEESTDGWFFASEDEATYRLDIRENGETNPMQARLVRLGETLFLDMFPEEVDLGDVNQPGLQLGDYYRLQLLALHTFVRIDAIGPELRIRGANHKELERLVSEAPEAIAHEAMPEGADWFFFTATPENLQKWLTKHQKAIFETEDVEPIVLKRRLPKTPSPE